MSKLVRALTSFEREHLVEVDHEMAVMDAHNLYDVIFFLFSHEVYSVMAVVEMI